MKRRCRDARNHLGLRCLRWKIWTFTDQTKEMNPMENRDDFVEIVELTIEELEERTAPGVIIWG